MGQDTVIWRLGCVRIFQMPGSRLRMRAAPSNSWSMAPKIEPLDAMTLRSVRLQPDEAERTVRRLGSQRQVLQDITDRLDRGRYNAVGMKTAAETGQEMRQRERAQTFTTISGRPIEQLYTAEA